MFTMFRLGKDDRDRLYIRHIHGTDDKENEQQENEIDHRAQHQSRRRGKTSSSPSHHDPPPSLSLAASTSAMVSRFSEAFLQR